MNIKYYIRVTQVRDNVSYSLKSTLSFSYYSRQWQINIRSFLVNEIEHAERNECAINIAAPIKLRFYVRILPYLRHGI